MQTADIQKLSANTNIKILTFGVREKRGTGLKDYSTNYTMNAVLLSNKRYSLRGHSHYTPSVARLSDVRLEESTSGRSDYGFLIKFDRHGDGTSWEYTIVAPLRIVATTKEYDDYWVVETARREQAAKEMADAQAKAKVYEDKKREVYINAITESSARQEALKKSIKDSLITLLGSKAQDINTYDIDPSGVYGGTQDNPTYEIKSWGYVRIPTEAVQVLIELALIGQEQ